MHNNWWPGLSSAPNLPPRPANLEARSTASPTLSTVWGNGGSSHSAIPRPESDKPPRGSANAASAQLTDEHISISYRDLRHYRATLPNGKRLSMYGMRCVLPVSPTGEHLAPPFLLSLNYGMACYPLGRGELTSGSSHDPTNPAHCWASTTWVCHSLYRCGLVWGGLLPEKALHNQTCAR